ncbi:hypothetical protein HAP47_0004385 [Bradyrhizobium sp. 41S5]|uniref:hypothetical protein n=1 Tax=Bradyrhizobium sp. 41S5 TaxID=1404443 RepID=UPI00156AB569|nr:hypothetical protein [Bradyrhizobium sp. 41S5]UFX45960.1 hypothetical protein HAP47_0004385 [Bradyrhizobium sp. 41S5]
MSNIVSFQTHKRRTRGVELHTQPAIALTVEASSPERWASKAQQTREALQEVVFALQINHARTCTMIERIENSESRKALLDQSRQIATLIDLAWSRLRYI